MRHWRGFIGVFFSAILLTACGGGTFGPARQMLPGSAGPQTSAARAAAAGYKTIYRFKGTPDGASPYAGLIAVGGTLYGTTLNGSPNYCSHSCGGNECYLGCGTIFSVDASGDEHVIYDFQGNFNNAQDGSWPFAGLTALNGTLYGTTGSAGAHGVGTVYSVSTAGAEHVLYSFAGGSDASAPEAGLTVSAGQLYGGTLSGGGTGCGGSGCGTVFTVSPAGKERVLYSFAGGSDGERMYAGVAALNGKIYGATLFGGGGAGCGSTGCGTIFEVSKTGKEHVLYRFTGAGDGAYPNGLTVVKGVLYGTTEGGGNKNSGTFFSVTTSGTHTVLYNFQDIPDGNLPGATLTLHKGSLYGTTVGGGTVGDGTVYKISTAGQEEVLYSFQGGKDGSDPQAPVYAFNGRLYGTTTQGGGTGCAGTGCGTIFKLRL